MRPWHHAAESSSVPVAPSSHFGTSSPPEVRPQVTFLLLHFPHLSLSVGDFSVLIFSIPCLVSTLEADEVT